MEGSRDVTLLKELRVTYHTDVTQIPAPSSLLHLYCILPQLFPSIQDSISFSLYTGPLHIHTESTYKQHLNSCTSVFDIKVLADSDLPSDTYIVAIMSDYLLLYQPQTQMTRILDNQPLLHWCSAIIPTPNNTIHFISRDQHCSIDILDMRFEHKAVMQVPRFYFASAFSKKKIYALGGIDSEGYSDVCEVYNIEKDSWEYIGNHPHPARSGAAATSFYDLYIFLFGGFDGISYTAQIDKYTEENGLWVSLSVCLPIPSYYMLACQVNNEIILIGGKDNNKAHMFNPLVNCFRQVYELPVMNCTRFWQTPYRVRGGLLVMAHDYNLYELEHEKGSWKYLKNVKN